MEMECLVKKHFDYSILITAFDQIQAVNSGLQKQKKKKKAGCVIKNAARHDVSSYRGVFLTLISCFFL